MVEKEGDDGEGSFIVCAQQDSVVTPEPVLKVEIDQYVSSSHSG